MLFFKRLGFLNHTVIYIFGEESFMPKDLIIENIEGQAVITGSINQAIVVFGGEYQLRAVWHCHTLDEIMVLSRAIDQKNKVCYGWTKLDDSRGKTFRFLAGSDQVLEMLGVNNFPKFANFLVTGVGLSFANTTGHVIYRIGCGNRNETIYPFHFHSLELLPSWLCWDKCEGQFVMTQNDPKKIMPIGEIQDSI